MTMQNLEKLLRAVEQEYKSCPSWQPLLERARREINALHRRRWEQGIQEMKKNGDA
jgi:hypothetical protein